MQEQYINEAKKTLNSMSYRNERILKFDKFVAKFVKAIDDLEKYERGMHNADIVDLIWKKVDFQAAFDALRGYSHFYTESLRGFIRRHQLRLADAWKHVKGAEEAYVEAGGASDNRRYYFLHRLRSTGLAITAEAQERTAEAVSRTDRELTRFVRTDRPATPTFDQARIAQITLYNLIRGDFQKALDSYEFLALRNPAAHSSSFQVCGYGRLCP